MASFGNILIAMLTIQQIKENPQYIIDRLMVKGFDGKEKIEAIGGTVEVM